MVDANISTPVQTYYRVVTDIYFAPGLQVMGVPLSINYLDIVDARRSMAFIRNNYPCLEVRVACLKATQNYKPAC